MAIVKMRFKTPDTGEFVPGSAIAQLKALPNAKPLTDGQDAILTDAREYDVPASGAEITTRATPFGWYYHIEGVTETGWKFHTNVYVPNDDTFDLDELVTLDPRAPFGHSRPEPQWWSAVEQLTETYAEGVTEARDRAETAADGAKWSEDAAHVSATAAEVARQGAESARDTAVSAAETAADDTADLVRTEFVDYTNRSETAANNAELSATDAETVAADLEAVFLGGTEAVNDAAVSAFVGTDGALTRTAINESFVSRGTQQTDVREWGALAEGVGAAAENTATINAALQGAESNVFLPSGEWHVLPGEIVIPFGKNFSGTRSAKYSGEPPTQGSRLRVSDPALTGGVVRLERSARVADIAIIGASANIAEHSGVVLDNFSTVERVTVTRCFDGITGNNAYRPSYANGATVRDVNSFNNSRHGLSNLTDSLVDGGFYNVNRSNGLSFNAGANDNIIRPVKSEWNAGNGISLFECNNNIVSSVIIDRCGTAGIRAVNTKTTVISNVVLRRNGRISEGSFSNDTHMFLQGNDVLEMHGIVTVQGENDGGGGYLSPANSTVEIGNSDITFVSCNLRGSTGTLKRQVVDELKPARLIAVSGIPSASRSTGQKVYIDRGYLGNLAAGAIGTIVIPAASVSTFNVGEPFTLQLVARNPSTGSRQMGEFKALPHRGSGDASVDSAPPVAFFGSEMGSTITVAFSANNNGTAITLTVSNNTSGSRAIYYYVS